MVENDFFLIEAKSSFLLFVCLYGQYAVPPESFKIYPLCTWWVKFIAFIEYSIFRKDIYKNQLSKIANDSIF